MRFVATDLSGVFVVHPAAQRDDRGSFARVWCDREAAAAGISARWVQSNLAQSRCRGTLRGVHYQSDPHWEQKLVRCVRGSAHVVAVDLRPTSTTFAQHVAVTLTAENQLALYVPVGCAQGYQTLEDDTDLLYQMSHEYVPAAARGLRYNDPALQLSWPLAVSAISDRDQHWPDFRSAPRARATISDGPLHSANP